MALLASPAALACSCVRGGTPEQHLQASTLIFSGRVESAEPKPGRARFKVHTVYKGEIEGDTVEIAHDGGGTSCSIGFAVGATETIYAAGSGETQAGRPPYGTHYCSLMPYKSAPDRHQPLLDAYRAAIDQARQRTRAEPKSFEAWSALANLLETNRDLVPAVGVLARLRELAPTDATLVKRHADALMALGRYPGAIEAYQAALTSNPADAHARRGRTAALLKLGRTAELDPATRDFAGMNASKLDLSGRDLNGATFVKAYMERPSFARARLANADFSGAVLQYADFRNADLRGAQLAGTVASSSDFSGATLADANLAGARLIISKLDGADLTGAQLTGALLDGASLVGVKLVGARLAGANLPWTDLSGADLSELNLEKQELPGARLRGAKLVNANLSGAYLGGQERSRREKESFYGLGRAPDVRGADFTGATLDGADLRFALFDCTTRWPAGFIPADHLLIPVSSKQCPGAPPKTKLFERPGPLREIARRTDAAPGSVKGPTIEKEDWTGINLAGANLTGFVLRDVVLRDARLREADFRNATLERTDFGGADLTGADLRGAHVRAVDFSRAVLAGAVLRGTVYDAQTRWPTGFDAVARGAVLDRAERGR